MSTKEDLEIVLEKYLNKYNHQNKNTLNSKKSIISDFIKSLPNDITEIDFENIRYWQLSLNNERNTINGKLCILRQFLEFVSMCGIKTSFPIIKKYHDSYRPYMYSSEEIALIINAADTLYTKNTKQFCIPMIFRLLISCGLRLGETVGLKISDYDLLTGTLKLTKTKGNKQRYVPLHKSMKKIMEKYIYRLKEEFPKTTYLFPKCNSDDHLTMKQIQYEFKKIRTICNITLPHKKFERGPCIHCFRHYFVFQSFRKTALEGTAVEISVPYLSTYLGHDSLMETEKYLKFTYDMYPEAMGLFEKYTVDLFEEDCFHA